MKSLDLEHFWNRLPTFRVVAERENLQDASRLLKLSPSSISRTIRLLEGDLGRALFTRDGGRLRLTPGGRDFLQYVRRAMRLVDDGATALRATFAGPFRLSVPRALTALVAIPAVERAMAVDPNLCVHITHDADAGAVAAGVVDLAVVTRPPESGADAEVHCLGEIPLAVFCGQRHPLWRASEPTAEEVLSHPFVTTSFDALEVGCWSGEHRRRVAVQLSDAQTLLDACSASLGAAVLPTALGRHAVARGELRRLPIPELRPARLFALRRPLMAADRAATMLDALTRSVSALEGT